MPSDARTQTLLDVALPSGDTDAALARSGLIEATAAVSYDAARHLDFMTVHSPLTDAAMFVRGIPNRVRRIEEPPPPRMVLGDANGLPGWSVFAEDPGREVVFGAVGRFWTAAVAWHDALDIDEFRRFGEPGWGKIACSLRVDAVGDGRTDLTYECRTRVTDPISRRKFLRYWRLIHPFVGHIFGATVNTIRLNAEQAAKKPARRP